MKAAVVTTPGSIEIVEVADPVPMDHQAVVAVAVCGICGTDVHVHDGDYGVVRYPVIPGHEFAGTVVEIGRGVGGLAVGDRVAVDPMDYCDACQNCRAGWTNMCLRGGGLGTTAPGALAEYVAVNAARCEPIPADMTMDDASLVEPLSCVLHGVDRIGPVLGNSALVFGAGPIGLMMTTLLARAGARVDVVDVKAERLDAAMEVGASGTGTSAAEVRDGHWEVVVDATGSPAAVAQAVSATGRTGRLALMGVAGPGRTFDFEPFEVVARELTILGVNSVRHSFGRARALLADGVLRTDLLHGTALRLDEVAIAIERSRTGSADLKTRVSIMGETR